MDPATIVGLTAACYAIAQHATGFIHAINDLRARYSNVDLRVTGINARTGVLRAAINRLDRWLDQNGVVLEEDERRDLRQSVRACELLISTLRRAAESASRRTTGRLRRTKKSWAKWKIVWEQRHLDQYTRDLNDQVDALELFLQTLNL
jgi:hypothetical protein